MYEFHCNVPNVHVDPRNMLEDLCAESEHRISQSYPHQYTDKAPSPSMSAPWLYEDAFGKIARFRCEQYGLPSRE